MKKIKPEQKKILSKCYKCNRFCCKYITVKIPAPRTIRDFDGLLWQLSHKNIKAFRDATGWHLLIYTPCSHLKHNGECGIYKNRPITCRDHSNEYCEYDVTVPKSSFQYFGTSQELEKFCKRKFRFFSRLVEPKVGNMV